MASTADAPGAGVEPPPGIEAARAMLLPVLFRMDGLEV